MAVSVMNAHAQDQPLLPSTNALESARTGPESSDTPAPDDVSADSPSESGKQILSFEDIDTSEIPEDYRDALKKATQDYQEACKRFRELMVETRIAHLQYLNNQVDDRPLREKFRKLRAETLLAMEKAFYDGTMLLDLIRNYPPAIKYVLENGVPFSDLTQFLVTVCKHHFEHDTYDKATALAGVLLFQAGSEVPTYLFLSTARAAACNGDFKLALQIYESGKEYLEKCDLALVAGMERLEEDWKSEENFRKQEEREDKLPRVRFSTTRGEFIAELYIDQAPSTVSRFISLVEEGFYDGLDFYQVVPNLLALTGDESGTGRLSDGPFLEDEHAREDSRAAVYGSLIMAKVPIAKTTKFVPNSASTQFAITYLPLPNVAEQQTVFGRVTEGMHVLGHLRRVDPSEKKGKDAIVLPPDRIIKAEMIRRPKQLPEVKFAESPGSHEGHNHP